MLQFGASVLLVTATAVVYRQMGFMTSRKLGYDKEHVISVWVYNNNEELRRTPEVAKRRFLQHPGVLQATVMMGDITNATLVTVRPEGFAQDVEMHTLSGDEDALAVYGLTLVAGRNIERPGEYLLNETAVQRLGWADPIGKQVQATSHDMPAGAVVGVVKDFHFESFRQPVKPLFLSFCPFPQTLALRLSPVDLPATMAFLEEAYEELVGQAFWYRFLDESVDALYAAEARAGRILLVFGLLALGAACLGLVGLAAFAAEQRT
ncbi:MAG: hypothetical protein AB1505_30420, partial [Candidatus Latescibacterota bacterium]